MKRLAMILAMLILLAGLVPIAWAQGPAGLTSAQPAAVDMSLVAGANAADFAAAQGDPGHTLAILDDFNRADGPIGPNWTVHDGYCNVSSNAAVCGNVARATFNGAPGVGDVAEADIATVGTSLQYTGLLLDYGAGNTNLFLKVQQQSPYPGQFTHAACYTGNQGDPFGLGFFALSAPFSTAHMRATRVGDDVTIEFTNIDGGGGSQTYVCTGAPPREGTGIGIIGYAAIARLDNFGVPSAEPIIWGKTIDGVPWVPDMEITRQTSDTIVVQEVLQLTPPQLPLGATTNSVTPLTGYGTATSQSSLALAVAQGPVYAQIETWNLTHLRLLDWAATGGAVIVEPGRLEWTGEILEPLTITLTKWFHVEPCTWTQTLLWEELWLDGVELEQRPVLINKLPPQLWIDSDYDPIVCPGMPAQFALNYGNLGGYENDVVVRNEFPPEALFASSVPPPDNVDPNGLWAEWEVGSLPGGAQGRITVTVDITATVLPGQLISVYDWIIDHVGGPADVTEIVFEVGAPDITVDPPALWAELCPDAATELLLEICNVGDCALPWALDELTPTLWLSADPLGGTLPAGMCQPITVSLDAAGLPPGAYVADLLIDSNDPDAPQIVVPVVMTVQQPAAILAVTTVITDLTVAFTPDVVGSAPIDYLWTFGDSGTSTETNPIHIYAEEGCYTVTLAVTNACGAETWMGAVCVGEPCDPVHDADFGWAPQIPLVDEMVYFTATAAGTGPITYDWDLGDGTSDSGEFVNHAYTAAATYTVVMTATNACGSDVATHDVVVSGEAPMHYIYLPLVMRQ